MPEIKVGDPVTVTLTEEATCERGVVVGAQLDFWDAPRLWVRTRLGLLCRPAAEVVPLDQYAAGERGRS